MTDIEGFCDERFRPLGDLFRHNLETGIDKGASLAVTLGGELVVDLWGGPRDPAGTPWVEDTIAPLYSTSKVMMIIATLMAWDRGLLDIDTPIAEYWPEFAANGKQDVTIRQVLVHRSGLPGFGRSVSFDELHDWAHMVAVVESAPLWHPPDTITCYCMVISGFVLGELLQRRTGRPFASFCEEEIAAPLGADVHFGLSAEDQSRVSHIWPPDSFPELPTDLARRCFAEFLPGRGYTDPDRMAAVLPSVNAYGNARGLARVGAMLAMGGALHGRRYLSRGVIEQASSEQNYSVDEFWGWCRYGLGFGLHSAEYAAPTPTTFHWGGFGGSFASMDMATGVSCGYVPNLLRADENGLAEKRRMDMWAVLGKVTLALPK